MSGVGSRIARALRLLVSAGLVAWLVARSGPAVLASALAASNLGWLTLAVLSVPPSIGVRACSLYLLANKDRPVISFPQAFRLTLVGVSSSLFLPPGVADLARAHLGYRFLGRAERIVSAALLDRATSLIALGALGAAAAAATGSTALATAAAIMAVAVALLVARPSMLPWAWVVRRLSPGATVDVTTLKGALRVPTPTLAAILGISMLGWFTTALSTYLVCLAVGAQLGMAEVTLASLLAALARLIPLSAAGIGVGEWTLSLLLQRFGLTQAGATTVALLVLLIGVLLPGVAGLFVRLSAEKDHEHACDPSPEGGRIRRMTTEDTPSAAKIHARRLSGSLIDGLGPRFLAAYYDTFAHDRRAIALIALDDGRVVGAAVGAPRRASVYRAMARRHLPTFLAGLVKLAVTHPRELLGALKGDEADDTVVLHVLAVDERAEGRGIGRGLLGEFLRISEAQGASVSLTTKRDDNDGVRGLYERAGFVATRELPRGGRVLVEYERVPAVSRSPRAG